MLIKRGSYNKKGQVTIFVIIAILVLVGVAVVVFLVPQIAKPAMSAEEAQVFLSGQTGAIKTYVQDCMETSAIKSINTLGRQGGRIIQTSEHFSVPAGVMLDAPVINYALFNDKDKGYINELPSIAEMQNELQTFLLINPDFDDCINDFSSFRKKGLDISAGAMTIDTANMNLGETNGKIEIPFTYPLTVSIAGARTTVDNYAVTIPINLAGIRELASTVTNSIVEGKGYEKIVQEQALQQELALRNEENVEEFYITSIQYDTPPSDKSGVNYNEKNTLFTISHDQIGLDGVYIFNFLIGK